MNKILPHLSDVRHGTSPHNPHSEGLHAPNSVKILWIPPKDEARLLTCALNNTGAAKRAAELLQPQQFKHPQARRIFGALLTTTTVGVQVTPESVAAYLQALAEAEASQDEVDALEVAAEIVLRELTVLPKNVGALVEEVEKLARKLTRTKRRERQCEATPEEIVATAEAIEIPNAIFSHYGAAQLPAPAITTGERPEYDARQLVDLLYPHFIAVALTTEGAHGERIRHYLREEVLYCPSLGWLSWAPKFWRQDDKEATATAAKVFGLSATIRSEAGALYGYAGTLASAGRAGDAAAMSRAANDLLTHAKRAESRHFIASALHFAAGFPQMRVEIEEFQPRPFVVPFQNVVWDNGTLREHRRNDCFLNLFPVALDGKTDGGEWRALLERITGGDQDFARTLQDVSAAALSGAPHFRALPWFYGPKGTGKSTFTELLQTVAGRDATTIDPKQLQDDSSRERLGATLWGKRLAVVAEAGNQKLDAELLKTLSGGDTLRVRFLYKEGFDARASHSLLLVANDPPRTDAYDDALKDRVMALPFVHPLAQPSPLSFSTGARIEAVRCDPKSTLVQAFANWAVEGLERLRQQQGIFRAASVQTATAQFWADTDPLTPFWETVTENELRAGITKKDLRLRYEGWCQERGERTLNRNQWSRACRAQSLETAGRNGREFWLKTSAN